MNKFYPYDYIDSVYEFDFKKLHEDGVNAVIFDIDNTLVKHGAPADKKAIDFFNNLKEIGLKKYELSLDEERVYLTEWNDFQAEFDTKLGFEKQLSLKTALDMAGVDFLGREHSALDDARNTAKLFNIFNDREMFDCTLKKIAEAMKPTDFGTSLGSMFDLSGFAVA